MSQNESSGLKKLMFSLGAHPMNDQVNELNVLLQNKKIESDPIIVQTLLDNFSMRFRLLDLFTQLKKYNILLTDKLLQLIASDVSKIGSIASLLEFAQKMNIGSQYINLEALLTLSFSCEYLIRGLQQLKAHDSLNPDTIELMFKYPDTALGLADFLIKIEEHYGAQHSIENLLKQFSRKNMYPLIQLLLFLLKSDQFYPAVVNVLLKEQEYINGITDGVTTLVADNMLSPFYFSIIENNAKNANIIAKIILLLSRASLINYQNKEDLLMVGRLGVGEFFFLQTLENVKLLNSDTYRMVCQNSALFAKEEFIDAISKLPLSTIFILPNALTQKEVKQLLSIINKPETSIKDYDLFIEIISCKSQPQSSFRM